MVPAKLLESRYCEINSEAFWKHPQPFSFYCEHSRGRGGGKGFGDIPSLPRPLYEPLAVWCIDDPLQGVLGNGSHT